MATPSKSKVKRDVPTSTRPRPKKSQPADHDGETGTRGSATLSKSKVNLLSVITGPWPLLGLFLLVTEGLLGSWLFRAENSVERGFSGLLMTLILGGLLYAVIRMSRKEIDTLASHQGVTTVKPPEGEVTEKEIASPAPETIPGPDRSYLIDLPPEGWRIRELAVSDWISEAFGIKDPATKQKLFPSDQSRDILIFEREKQTSIIPIPGRTTIDGRKTPTALEVLVPTQLTILPVERAQPPLFVERSLEHNFLVLVGQMLSSGVLTARQAESGLIRHSGRRYFAVELQQKIEDAIVNGKEGQGVFITINFMGIQGELRDHMLMIKYVTMPGNPELERDLQTLQTLVASFRPVKIVNAEGIRREIAARADENFNKLLTMRGKEMFKTELSILALRLQGTNLDDSEARLRTIKLLKPFELFAREIDFHDEEFDALWEALHRAEVGDATDFKAELTKLIQAAVSEEKEEQAEGATLPPPANAEPEDPSTPLGKTAPS
jgi:hypothetical protein